MSVAVRTRRPLCGARTDHLDALPPVLSRVYRNRVSDPGDLILAWDALPSFDLLADLPRAAARLAEAVRRNERIVISGDYDSDGSSATAVLVRALRAFGVEARFIIPDRMREGYGLSVPLARRLVDEFHPQIVITVDNGISAHEGIALLENQGIPVLCTDHHLPGSSLPGAYAIVNPRRQDDIYPSKALAGVGVAFALAVATRARLIAAHWDRTHPAVKESLAPLLDLVALGTVADVVPLDRVNRLLIDQGLQRLRASRGSSPGITALAAVAGRPVTTMQAQDLAFSIAPRLNAAGRLADMTVGVRLLITDDPREAVELAHELDAINRQRRDIEDRMREQAEIALGGTHLPDASGRAAITLFDPSWHEGVVGLVAGRIKDKTHRPVVAFAPGAEGLLKGSARSISGVHIRDVLARLDAEHPGWIVRFGGHAAAAGLSLKPECVGPFEDALNEAVLAVAPDWIEAATLWTDGVLAPEEFTIHTARSLRDGGPWGQGFPPPRFMGEFTILSVRMLSDGLHARMSVVPEGGKTPLTAIAFHCPRHGWSPVPGSARFVYGLEVNSFRGDESAQIVVDEILPEAPMPSDQPAPGAEIR